MSTSIKVAPAGNGFSTPAPLTDAELEAFWARVITYTDAARALAAKYVGRADADDIVHSAAILFIESFSRPGNPAKYPRTDEEFRRCFLKIVHNHATDCVRSTRTTARPVHSHWGSEPEPLIGGRKLGDRSLDRVFARNDRNTYDAPASDDQPIRGKNQDLDAILSRTHDELPSHQNMAIYMTFIEGYDRHTVAELMGISVNTYDVHMQRAYKTFRKNLTKEAAECTDAGESIWYRLIEELNVRYERARFRRAGAKKRARSTAEVEGSTNEGDGRSAPRADAA
jgi:RNA polymerase sigma factor (sigma-70 family)